MTRDDALRKIQSLQRLADPKSNNSQGERDAALAKIADLKAKHGITTTPPPKSNTGPTQAQRDAARQRAENAAAQRRAYEAMEAERRRKAQAEWERKNRNRDARGNPIPPNTPNDPFEWPTDTRTHAQRQQDLNNSRGKQGSGPWDGAWDRERERRRKFEQDTRDREAAWKATYTPPPDPEPQRCEKPETYFDQGGNPRARNQHVAVCNRCGTRLNPGDGAVTSFLGRWIVNCCEKTPGPRAKRPSKGR